MPPRFLIPAPSGGTAGPFRKMNTLSLPVRLLRRAVLLALMMFLLSVVVFVFARLAPGDPLQSFYGDSLEQMTDAEKAAARRRLGLPVDELSWGSILSLANRALLTNFWWLIVLPGLFLMTTLLCITRIGSHLRRENARKSRIL